MVGLIGMGGKSEEVHIWKALSVVILGTVYAYGWRDKVWRTIHSSSTYQRLQSISQAASLSACALSVLEHHCCGPKLIL